MSTAYTKQKLKQSRDYLAKKDWKNAFQSASDVLEHEPDNYTANVFLGLALLNLERYDESEAAYRNATQHQPNQPLAWQGLEKFYTERKNCDQLRHVLRRLIDLHNDAGDATKCAEAHQRLVSLEREEGGKRSLVEALELLLPDSPYYATLSSLEPPDQTQPLKTTTFDTQMAIHLNALALLLEMVDLTERLEADVVEKETEKRRMRLDGARKGKQALRNEVVVEVYAESKLPSFYDQVLSHPNALDELRRETESKLLRRQLQLLNAYPSSAPRPAAPTGTAAVNPEKAAEQQARDEELRTKKQELRDRVIKMAEGMVIIGFEDETAWEIVLEWRDSESLIDLPLERLRKFISLFPRSGRSKSFQALLLLIQDEQFLLEREEMEKLHDIEIDRSHDNDLLGLAIEGLEESSSSLLGARIASVLYLLDRDYASASEVATSALSLAKRIEDDSSVTLAGTKFGISTVLLTALTHLHPPQNHAKAIRIADAILAHDEANVDALLARAYIDQAASRWDEAKAHLLKVQQLASVAPRTDRTQRERRLSISPDPGLEAWIEVAWCDVHLGRLVEAKAEMEEILAKVDPVTFEGVGSEERAKIWWRLGRCLWGLGGEYRSDPVHAFTCFITSLKRNPAFAPSYTSLGIYYESVASPPDAIRASKCFQKAFELDARENEAARRLAEGFADEREWDLVEVVARRTIEGEGGAEALAAGAGSSSSSASIAASRRHLSQNAWAWKAIGGVEIARKSFEKAILAFQIALRAQPEDATAWQRLGEAYASAGRHVAALKCFDKCLDLIDLENQQALQSEHGDGGPLNDGWQARYCIGDVQRQLGNYEAATEIFSAILDNHPGELGVRVALADTLLMSARNEYHAGYVERSEESVRGAIRQAGKALRAEDRHLRSAWKTVADATFQLSRLGRVLDPQLLLQDPEDADGNDAAGGLQALLDLATEMETDAKLPSINAVTRATVDAALALLSSESAKMVAHSDVFVEVAIYFYKLRIILNAADTDAAGGAWADLSVSLYRLSRSPSADEAHAANLTRQAIGSIKEALRSAPGDEGFWLILGNLTFTKSLKVAQHAYIRAIESASRSAIPWANLGFLYLHHGDVALANEAFIKAQTADPDAAEAWVGQALVASHHGDARARRVLFDHAVKLSQGALLEADYGFGESVFHTFSSSAATGAEGSGGDKRQMADLHAPSHALATYLSHKPTDVDALHLSALFCERLGQTDAAIERIERAAALLEEEYERSESTETARRYAIANVNLGRIRLANGDAQGAEEAYEAAIELLHADEEAAAEAAEEGTDADDDDVDKHEERYRMARVRINASLGHALTRFHLGDAESSVAKLTELGATIEALSPLLTAEEVESRQVTLLCHLSRVLLARGEAEEAQKQLLQSIATYPRSLLLIATLATLGIAENDEDLVSASIGELQEAENAEDPEVDKAVSALMALYEFGKGKIEEGLDVLRSRVRGVAEKVELVEALVRFKKEAWEEAERVLEECTREVKTEEGGRWRARVFELNAVVQALRPGRGEAKEPDAEGHQPAPSEQQQQQGNGQEEKYTTPAPKQWASLAVLCAPWEARTWQTLHSVASLAS
ncbi:Superkiller protein 3 [Thecaphora frezii]